MMQIRSVFEGMLMKDQACLQQKGLVCQYHFFFFFFNIYLFIFWLPLVSEDEMVGWHHRLDGHEFEQASGVGNGHGSLARCSPWGRKESDMTKRLN